jgi:DNA-directed RNA polymerase subunit RPC12/RpoP
MFYNGELGKLQCEFCGSSFTTQEIEQIYAEMQAKADAEASKGRTEQLMAEAGIDPAELSQRQLEAVQAAYQQGMEAGKAPEQIQADMQAALEGVAAAVPQQTAAQASTSEAVKAEPAVKSTGDPIQTYLQNAKRHDVEADGLRSYTCSACAAQLIVDQVTAVTSCPYCGNNTVLPGQLSDVLQPDYVVPFRLDKQAAIDALKGYYQGKRFLPNNFTNQNHIEEIQGIYVPFWLYSGRGSGDVEFKAENVRV